MVAWQVWLIIAGVCFIIEIATVGFLVFWFAIAALITCLLSLVIPSIIAQTAIFVVLSAVLILLTRSFANKISKKDNVITNSNALIGKECTVTKQIEKDQFGQVKVCGDTWTAVVKDYSNVVPVGSTVKILAIDGVKLVVEPVKISALKN